MTLRILREWQPDQDLAKLLDAGAAELLAATDREIADELRKAGAEGREVVEAVRALARAAADNDIGAPPATNFVAPKRRIDLARDS
jgi:hypothetical protein